MFARSPRCGTGYGQEQDQRHALAAGIDQILTRPVHDEMLQALIDTAITP